MANPTELDLILRALELMQGDAQPATPKKRKKAKTLHRSSGKSHGDKIRAGIAAKKRAAKKIANRKAAAKKR